MNTNVILLITLCLGVFLYEAHANLAEVVLKQHNKYRKIHDVGRLTLNSDMSRSAKKWANHLAKIKRLEHSRPDQRDGHGENLYYYCGRSFSAKLATTAWYNEVCHYNFETHRRESGVVGHFTQLVWKDSENLGVGKVTNGDCTYVVARYDPAGNWIGNDKTNVFKGSFNRATTCGKGK